jgi:hypothetical protein
MYYNNYNPIIYGLNFSRCYPRVVVRRNFSVQKEPGFFQRHPILTTLAGAGLGGLLMHGLTSETDLGDGMVQVETRRVTPLYLLPVTYFTDKLPSPIDTYANTAIGAGVGGLVGYGYTLPEENEKRSRRSA